jgi:hypothetical protein
MPEEPTTPDLADRAPRALDAITRRDNGAVGELMNADAVWEARRLGMSLHGVAAMREVTVEWQQAYDDFSVGVEESRVLGVGTTFAVFTHTTRPGMSAARSTTDLPGSPRGRTA